jgi:hypothetical protein
VADKAWKARERKCSKWFGTTRTALSGGNSKITRSDSLHSAAFIEVKLRKKHTVITLWDETKKLADEEKKIPIIALCEKNRPGFWLMFHEKDAKEIAKIILQQ